MIGFVENILTRDVFFSTAGTQSTTKDDEKPGYRLLSNNLAFLAFYLHSCTYGRRSYDLRYSQMFVEICTMATCLRTTVYNDDEGGAVKMTVEIPLEKLVGRFRGTDDWYPPSPANTVKNEVFCGKKILRNPSDNKLTLFN